MKSNLMSIRKATLAFCATVLTYAFAPCLAQSGAEAIHPMTRQTAWPSAGQEVEVNPPSLLWPVVRDSAVHYRVRLSQDPQLRTPETIISQELLWAIFNPHAELARGKWYW